MNCEVSQGWEFHNPTKIVFGLDARANLNNFIGDGPILIVTSARGRVSVLKDDALKVALDRPAIWIDDVQPNPDLAAIENQIARIGAPIESVVAIGGGSAIDAAKTIAAALSCHARGVRLADLIENPNGLLTRRSSRLVVLPTTAGTGAEVTPFATVWDQRARKKMSLAHPLLFPDVAIVDPVLTFGVPENVTIATGLDALNQALESVWNKNATPYTRQLAARAVKQAMNALSTLATCREAVEARVNMSEASLLAGICISQTRTAICHSISYPLTAHFDMPHGLACAFTMRAVAQEVTRTFPAEFGQFTELAGFGSSKDFLLALDQLYADWHVDALTSHYVSSQDALFSLRHEMVTPGRSGNFTIDITDDLISRILLASLERLLR